MLNNNDGAKRTLLAIITAIMLIIFASQANKASAIFVTSPPRIISVGDVSTNEILNGTILGQDINTTSTFTFASLLVTGTSSFSGAVAGISLNEIEDLTSDKTFTMAANNLIWNFTTPSMGMQLNATGAFTDHVMNINQDTGNPGPGTQLLHLTANDNDVIGLDIDHRGASTSNAMIVRSGTVFLDGGNVGIGTTTADDLLTISGGDLNMASSTNSHLRLPQRNNASMPTLAFGDGDTGIYEESANVLRFTIGGAAKFFINSSEFRGTGGTGAGSFVNGVSSATTPVWTFGSDIDTGVGRAAADMLSLTAGGVEMGRFDDINSQIILTGKVGIGTSTPFAALSVVGSTGLVTGHFNATSTTATSTISGDLKVTGNLEFGDGSIQITRGKERATSTQFTTAGTSTWPVPNDITRVKVTLVGGGGGGGGTGGSCSGGSGGGGGGAFVQSWIDVTPNTGLAVFIGLGGNKGQVGNTPNNGVTGSSTVFFATSTRATAEGGTGGDGCNDGAEHSGGTGGSSPDGDFIIDGDNGRTSGTTHLVDGRGGDSHMGTGAIGLITDANAASADKGFGGGGTGGRGANKTGGNGDSGFIIIEWIE